MPNRAQVEFVQIIGDLGACDARERVLSLPSIEHGWVHGIPANGRQMISIEDDLSWWLVQNFAPKEYPFAKRIFHAVPGFFFDLARLAGTPGRVDWNFIFHLRRRLLREMWPTAYQVATGAIEGRAGSAAEKIRRLTTVEQWHGRS